MTHIGRKLAVLAIAAMAMAILVAGCGGSDNESTDGGGGGSDISGSLTIESWRTDDQAIWDSQIIPAFNEAYPNIEVTFAPTAPTEYNAALRAKLNGGTAGDLITCRPFDESLGLFDDGHLASLNDLDGMENFDDVAKSAWQTDDGSTTFCVPMASVIHGFIYNQDAFDKVGVEVPETEAEFLDVLQKIKDEGTYVPLAMGTKDLWEAATMGFQNIGPQYWNGEEGRKALIAGEQKLTDEPYVDTLAALAKWGPFLPKGASSVTYPDAQTLFTSGKAAIYPAGSWEISGFNEAGIPMGAFPPPKPAGQDTCYISDHTDIGIGMNAKTDNEEAARAFLSWVASSEFGTIFSNALPGFFSLQSEPVELEDPLAQEFVSWRDECESTIRNSYQILSRGTPNLENELWAVSAAVLNGSMTPQAAATRLQNGLDRWYKPGESS